MVKENLKRWNQDDFGNIDSQIHKLETAIQEFDDKSNQRDLEPEELEAKKEA